jgi:hypothetical protein
MNSLQISQFKRRLFTILVISAVFFAGIVWYLQETDNNPAQYASALPTPSVILTQHVPGGPLIAMTRWSADSQLVITNITLSNFEYPPRFFIDERLVPPSQFSIPDSMGKGWIDKML